MANKNSKPNGVRVWYLGGFVTKDEKTGEVVENFPALNVYGDFYTTPPVGEYLDMPNMQTARRLIKRGSDPSGHSVFTLEDPTKQVRRVKQQASKKFSREELQKMLAAMDDKAAVVDLPKVRKQKEGVE